MIFDILGAGMMHAVKMLRVGVVGIVIGFSGSCIAVG
jgi:hypothetical protein